MTPNTVEEALEAIRLGKLIIVADDDDRENEGDFVCAADKVSPDLINLMATEGRGLICLTLTPETCDRLQLFPMVQQNTDPMGTAFTVSVDARPEFGVGTGISAFDRARTIQVAVAAATVPDDLRRPGHIFPLRARPGGVLERVGHTEAAVDIARLAGLTPAGVICEILNPDGTMARRDQLEKMAQKLDIPIITVAQLVAFRLQRERLVTLEAEAMLPTEFGVFRALGFRNMLDGCEHLALVCGDIAKFPQVPPLVRVHSECLTGDVLGSLRCDCGAQLHEALRQIGESGKGVLVYLRNHEGRGIGLLNKIKAYALQDQGMDTVEANVMMGFPADLRDYGVGAQILRALGVSDFRLLTNNPRKLRGLDGYGLNIVGREPLLSPITPSNQRYLQTKQDKLGRFLMSVAERARQNC